MAFIDLGGCEWRVCHWIICGIHFDVESLAWCQEEAW